MCNGNQGRFYSQETCPVGIGITSLICCKLGIWALMFLARCDRAGGFRSIRSDTSQLPLLCSPRTLKLTEYMIDYEMLKFQTVSPLENNR